MTSEFNKAGLGWRPTDRAECCVRGRGRGARFLAAAELAAGALIIIGCQSPSFAYPMSGADDIGVPGIGIIHVHVVRQNQDAAAFRYGLSGQAVPEPGSGMLFIFRQRGRYSFWMPDMTGRVDIAWIDTGKIIGMSSMFPCVGSGTDTSCPRWHPPGAIDAALEVSAGGLRGLRLDGYLFVATVTSSPP